MSGIDANEVDAGRRIIRTWPRAEILSCAKLPAREQELVMLGAALLDMRPGAPEGNPKDVIEIDWRGWR